MECKGIQTRLLDENKALAVERSRLADLLGNVQKMHNDFERANESDRRRLESHIQSLENQAFVYTYFNPVVGEC